MEVCSGYDLKLEGLTFKQFTAFYKTALEQEYEDLRRLAAMHGAELPPLHKNPETDEELARVKDNDPLLNFPFDVIYLTSQQCDEQILYYDMLDKRGVEVEPFRVWDNRRKEACLGDDMAARRCSMNNVLWEAYCKNPSMSLSDVKRKIQFDITKSKLYPSGWHNYTQPPPIEHIHKLKESGQFDLIMEQLQELAPNVS